jgi:hypothetical protein
VEVKDFFKGFDGGIAPLGAKEIDSAKVMT